MATALLAVCAALMPVVSAFGHLDAALPASLDDREIVVTGHDERDFLLHVEARSDVVVVHCPECVLDKKQSGASAAFRLATTVLATDRHCWTEVATSWHRELSPSSSPRAPPVA